MSYIIFDILKTSLYISVPIILIALFKDKVLSKYTYKLNYMLCILITIRMVFISSIEVYLPVEALKNKKNITLETINYITVNSNNKVNYIDIIFCIWVVGAIYVIARSIYKQVMFYKKIQNITYKVTEDEIIKNLKEEKEALNIKKDVNVFKVDGLSSPALVGIINNKILIPNKNFDKEELRWIFRHELTHLKRKDNLLKLLLMIASSIHWFNPLVKILKKYFEEQCELSCDEKVVKRFSKDEIKEYAFVLINTLRYRNTLRASIFSSQFNNNEMDVIKSRVEGMLSLKKRKKGTSMAVSTCIISLISVLSVSAISNKSLAYTDDFSLNESSENNKETPNKRYKDMTEEEILKNYSNNKQREVIKLYENKKVKDLTQEERDYALQLLYSGKYSEVMVGLDGSYSINLNSKSFEKYK